MFQGFLAVAGEPICGPSSRAFGNAGLSSDTGFWTANGSESPRDAAACSLSAVLQKRVSERYFLSPKAAAGILRRATKRGRELPPALRQALEQRPMVSERTGVRRLTPLECERLQGFPDGWTCLCGTDDHELGCKCPDSPRYRALGNAVTVNVIKWIGERLESHRGE